jgi:hypothetical protein
MVKGTGSNNDEAFHAKACFRGVGDETSYAHHSSRLQKEKKPVVN